MKIQIKSNKTKKNEKNVPDVGNWVLLTRNELERVVDIWDVLQTKMQQRQL